MTAKHRTDIDGLRALAVLPILLFHAGIPGFSGGYVGVDIFFVISGFLITAIIARELSGGTFSYVSFYERRIRRIFPALAVVLAFCLVAAWFILLPSEIADFAKSVLGTILFASNIVFFRQSGYFDRISEEKPLLHTWSLGIEEQFYIFFPIILFLIIRHAPRYRQHLVALIAAVSFGLCVYLTPTSPSAAFYLIPTRAWELLAGSLLALGVIPVVRAGAVRAVLSALGLAMIVAAIILFDGATPFPGVAALLPVAGTVLAIAYAPGTWTDRLLSLRPLVFIGLISYSLYLWHWPLIVFGRDLGWLDGSIGPAVAVVLVSVAMGALSSRCVETPFRDRSRVSQRAIYALAAAGALALLAAGIVALKSDGFRSRYPAQTLAFDDGAKDFSPMRRQCHPSTGLAAPEQACVFGGPESGAKSGAVPDAAMWADSHGVELAFALASPARPLRSMTYSACPPVIDYGGAILPSCARHNAAVLQYLLATPAIRTVYMAAYYNDHIRNPAFGPALGAAVNALVKGGKRVIVFGPSPLEGGPNLPLTLARHGRFRASEAAYRAQQDGALALLATLRAKGATVILPADYLCEQGSCAVDINGKPLLFDDDHLSLTGARHVVARASSLIDPDRAAASLRPTGLLPR